MRLLSMILAAALATSCGGGGGEPGDDAPDADPGPADPQFDEPANQVVVREARWDATQARGDVSAVFAANATGFFTETMRAGSCRLLTSDASYCAGTSCDGFCVADVCRPWPTYRDAGRITLTGLSEPVALTFTGGYYAPDSFPVPVDLFAAGDPIQVSAQGADVAAFSAATTGVAELSPQLAGACGNELHVTRGDDAVIQWSAPVAGSRVRVRIPSENNGHGLPSRAVIECEGPDTGELRVPAAMISAMPDFRDADGCEGVACVNIDCPPATMARYARAVTTAGPDLVVVRAESEITFLVHDQ